MINNYKLLTMFEKLKRPRLTKRELAILNECCRQVSDSMEKEESKNGLPPVVKQIKEDIQEIMKKLETSI